MNEVKEFFSIVGGLFALLIVPYVKYTSNKEARKAVEESENRILKMLAEQKVQIDKEYLDLRDMMDRKFDKLEMSVGQFSATMNQVVQSFNDRMMKTELETKELSVELRNGSKHYDEFQKTQEKNWEKVYSKLEEIQKEIRAKS